MDRFIYKGVLCRLSTWRVRGENRPALFYIDAPDQQTMLEAGFTDIQYGLWARVLTDEEYEEIINELNQRKNLFSDFWGKKAHVPDI